MTVGGGARRATLGFDALGVAWTVLMALAVMAPALRPGVSLGPFDLLSRFGLTFHAGAHVHNAIQADQIVQFVPWTYLAWHQVHSGQLPLWNPYNVLGMPLAFNWQSGVFSLPVAISYLFPVHLSYTVTVLAKLIVAGTGTYVLCRVLRLSPLASAFGGTVFELSGPIVVHAGWSMTGVTVWAGWLLAAVLMVLRSPRPWRHTLLLAVFSALAIYGGHPESVVILALCTLVFVVVYLVSKGTVGGTALAPRLGLLAVAGGLGLALASPLLLPGFQLGFASTRGSGVGASAFPISHLPNLLAAGLQGSDFRTSAYVGVITLVMAVAGARVAWNRPEVRALTAVAVLTGLFTFLGPLDDLLHAIPAARAVDWGRAVMVLALALAVLGAVGIDRLAKVRARDRDGELSRWSTWGLGVAAFVVIVIGLWGALGISTQLKDNLDRLIAPAVEVVVGLVVLWALTARPVVTSLRPVAALIARRAAPLLLVTESAVLVTSGVSFWSVSHGYFPVTTGTRTLEARVGSSLVGLGTCAHVAYLSASTKEVGIRADANIGYGIEELSVYDPILPGSYFKLWYAVSGTHVPKSLSQLGVFCPRITNATEARLFGAAFVLEPRGRSGPTGGLPDGAVGDEVLYRIPGSSRATLSPLPRAGTALSMYAPGGPLTIDQTEDGTWKMVVSTAAPKMLRLRLTAVPGWRATIDGHPLALSTWADHTMIEARIPPGKHVVEIRYWPRLFTVGIVTALCAIGAGVVSSTVVLLAKRRPRRRAHQAPTKVSSERTAMVGATESI